MSGTYFTKGKCEVCGLSYDKHAQQIDNDPSANIGEYTVNCPNCSYHPDIRGEIRYILEKDDDNIIIKEGKIVINSEKLSQSILEVIVKNWPKSKKKD